MRRLLLILAICLYLPVSSQDREAAIWHFGQFAGLDFNSLSPVNLNRGILNTIEGCSSIADGNGLLYFYTDGVTVYTSDHEIMRNGEDKLGSPFSTQSALIVPNPRLEGEFFVFTTSDIRRANQVLEEGDGLYYFRVSTGNRPGQASSQMIHLITYDQNERVRSLLKCSQKLTAVKHPEEDFYWLITHFEDTFYAFKVDERGATPSPVVSRTGPYIHLGAYGVNSKGQIKFSPDGTRLAMANAQNSIDSSGHSPGSLWVFDFDVDTGRLSGATRLMTNDFVFAYGVEFSPNSKKLYASVSSFRNGEVPPSGHSNTGSSLWQIDLEDNNRVRKIFDDDEEPTALQLAIDGKIYKAQDNRRYLGVINKPNKIGSEVNYVDQGLALARASQRGLPGFVQSFFQVRIDFDEACEGFETKLSTNYLPEPDNIAWDFGDGSPILNTTEKNVTHIYNQDGGYRVTATITKDGETESFVRIVTVQNLPEVNAVTITQCDEDGDGEALFNLYEPSERINPDPEMYYSFYFTEADAQNDTNEIPRNELSTFSNSRASRVYVRAISPFGCVSTTHIDLAVSSNNLPPNYMLYYSACDNEGPGDDDNGVATFDFSAASDDILSLFPDPQGLVVNYYRTYEQALAETNEIDPTNYTNVGSPFEQKIWVRVEGEESNTCIGLGQHLTLVVNEVPNFTLAETEVICQKQYPYPLQVKNPIAAYDYTWTDEDGHTVGTGAEFRADREGIYTVTATTTDGTSCSKSKSIEVTTILPPVITEIDVKGIIALRSSATVLLEQEEGFEYALDSERGPFQDSNIFYEVAPGIHRAYVRDKNSCELVSEEFSVIGYPAFFTPNNDGVNDYWQIQGVSDNLQAESLIHIYDRYGVLLAQIEATSQGWDGLHQGRIVPASDYWFRVRLEDGREFNGHFTLKR